MACFFFLVLSWVRECMISSILWIKDIVVHLVTLPSIGILDDNDVKLLREYEKKILQTFFIVFVFPFRPPGPILSYDATHDRRL